MSRRTLTARRLRFYRSHRLSEGAHPADLDGDNILSLIENWTRQLQPQELWDGELSHMVDIVQCSRLRPDALLLQCRVGKWGEAGPVVNTHGTVTGELEDDESPTVFVRIYVTVPDRAPFALYFSEESRRGAAGTRVIAAFNSWFSQNYAFTMKYEFCTTGEDWIRGAELKQVQVVVRTARDDLASTPEEIDAVVTHTVKLPRGKVFKQAVLDQLWRHPERAASYVMLSHMPDRSEVKLKLKNGDTEKTLVAGDNEGGAIIRELISHDGQPDLSSDELVALCDNRAVEMLPRLA